jgi:hypothetical protein
MVRRLTLFFILVSLAGGVLGGTPLHASSSQMMKCCDKAKSKDQTPAANAANLCCALNCSEATPVALAASFNFAPSNITVYKSIAEQVAALTKKAKAQSPVSPNYSRDILPRSFQPKYLQHHSFLI